MKSCCKGCRLRSRSKCRALGTASKLNKKKSISTTEHSSHRIFNSRFSTSLFADKPTSSKACRSDREFKTPQLPGSAVLNAFRNASFSASGLLSNSCCLTLSSFCMRFCRRRIFFKALTMRILDKAIFFPPPEPQSWLSSVIMKPPLRSSAPLGGSDGVEEGCCESPVSFGLGAPALSSTLACLDEESSDDLLLFSRRWLSRASALAARLSTSSPWTESSDNDLSGCGQAASSWGPPRRSLISPKPKPCGRPRPPTPTPADDPALLRSSTVPSSRAGGNAFDRLAIASRHICFCISTCA
mmetsp:Transcript_60670/g.174981  ORF Transcript_60670/g.174981 Transcript_60670/m.174981 type:complete len:299 (-) Transcript_60670:308-1204(-)